MGKKTSKLWLCCSAASCWCYECWMPMCGISAGCGHQDWVYTLQLLKSVLIPSTELLGSTLAARIKIGLYQYCENGEGKTWNFTISALITKVQDWYGQCCRDTPSWQVAVFWCRASSEHLWGNRLLREISLNGCSAQWTVLEKKDGNNKNA